MTTMRKAMFDQTDWGCDMQGRDLSRRGLNGGSFAARLHEERRAGAHRYLGHSEFLLRSVMAEATTAAREQ